MTPLQIEILLHYSSRINDYRHGDFLAPAVRDAINEFLRDHLLEPEPFKDSAAYRLTPRGRAYVDALCSLPLPVQIWAMPNSAREEM